MSKRMLVGAGAHRGLRSGLLQCAVAAAAAARRHLRAQVGRRSAHQPRRRVGRLHGLGARPQGRQLRHRHLHGRRRRRRAGPAHEQQEAREHARAGAPTAATSPSSRRATARSRRCSCSIAAAATRSRITDYKTGASAIAWSPDSTKLALLVSEPDPNDPEEREKEKDKKPKPHVITRLQFMRDGEGYLNDVKRHIHVFDIATKKDVQITSDRYDDGAPVWAPDGSLIAFSANRTDNPDANDNSDIYVIEPRAGAKPRALTTRPGSDGSPVFSPDGKSIAYLNGGDSRDIWYAHQQRRARAGRRRAAEDSDRRARSQSVASAVHARRRERRCSCSKTAATCTSRACRRLAARSSRIFAGERDISAFDIARTATSAMLQSHTAAALRDVLVVQRRAKPASRLRG